MLSPQGASEESWNKDEDLWAPSCHHRAQGFRTKAVISLGLYLLRLTFEVLK